MAQSPHAWVFVVGYLLIATFIVLNLFVTVVVKAMWSLVTDDLKVEVESHTQIIAEEVRALPREIPVLRSEVLPQPRQEV